MDPVTVVLGLLVTSGGASVAVAPRAVVRRLRSTEGDAVDPSLNRTRRTFGVVATLLGIYAVAMGTGLV